MDSFERLDSPLSVDSGRGASVNRREGVNIARLRNASFKVLHSSDSSTLLSLISIPIPTPSPTPPRTLLLTPLLLHLPRPRLIRLLQPLHTPDLLCTRLSRHHLPSGLHDQVLQFAKAGVDVLGLFAAVVGLDDDVTGFGGVVARGEN